MIENDKQLKTAQDFVNFLHEHNKRAKASVDATYDRDIYDIMVELCKGLSDMSKLLVVKQTRINELEKRVDALLEEVKDLEREVRVSKDLLAIAKNIT